MWSGIRSWDQAITQLDSYAAMRKEELNQRDFSKDASLIKSYMFETLPNGIDANNPATTVGKLLRATDWDFSPLNREDIYRVTHVGDFVGFLEVVDSRYLVLHTLKKSIEIDRKIKNTIRDSAKLDSVWLAGNYLNLIWDLLIKEYLPKHTVSFKFEHLGRFENASSFQDDDSDDEDIDTSGQDETATGYAVERHVSSFTVTSEVRKISRVLPELQNVLPDFKAIKMLRYPASETRGGYDFYDWGKVTYRSPSFRNGRAYLWDILNFYKTSVSIIEEMVWFGIEKNTITDGSYTSSIKGTPVTFVFEEALDLSTFNNFIEITFLRGQGPFRLWGDPVFINERLVHVYGVDLHLWQKIYLELTPSRFIAILPQGTCGNTVHRMVSNIQRFISPNVVTYIGDYQYSQLMKDIMLNSL